jgi:hypothetical protein
MKLSIEKMPCSIWSRQYSAADGIADVLLKVIQRFVEFAQQKSFFHRLRKEQVDGVHVAVGHAENIIGFLHQFAAQHAAAHVGNINAQIAQGAHGMGAGRQPLHGADAGGVGLEILAAPDGVLKESFGHRAAANIAGANK